MEWKPPSKKPLTEEDIEWCHEALAKAEPYSKEEEQAISLEEIADFSREKATRAKEMLERGWKY